MPEPAADAPAAPGCYPVGEVSGRCPAGLEDFLGVASFTVFSGDLTYLVFGTGTPEDGGVGFPQQDLGRDGRVIRTWLITATPTGIVANPDPAASPRADLRPAGPAEALG